MATHAAPNYANIFMRDFEKNTFTIGITTNIFDCSEDT